MTGKPTAVELLAMPGALFGVEHLRELGLDERAIKRVLRGLPEVAFLGVDRIYFAAEDVRERLRKEGRCS